MGIKGLTTCVDEATQDERRRIANLLAELPAAAASVAAAAKEGEAAAAGGGVYAAESAAVLPEELHRVSLQRLVQASVTKDPVLFIDRSNLTIGIMKSLERAVVRQQQSDSNHVAMLHAACFTLYDKIHLALTTALRILTRHCRVVLYADGPSPDEAAKKAKEDTIMDRRQARAKSTVTVIESLTGERAMPSKYNKGVAREFQTSCEQLTRHSSLNFVIREVIQAHPDLTNKVTVKRCAGEADLDLARDARNNLNCVGIISDDSDFFVTKGVRFLPMHWMHPWDTAAAHKFPRASSSHDQAGSSGVLSLINRCIEAVMVSKQAAEALCTPQWQLMCEVFDSRRVASIFNIPEAYLAEFAFLIGNDFTPWHNVVEDIATKIRYQLNHSKPVLDLVRDAISDTTSAFDGPSSWRVTLEMYNRLSDEKFIPSEPGAGVARLTKQIQNWVDEDSQSECKCPEVLVQRLTSPCMSSNMSQILLWNEYVEAGLIMDPLTEETGCALVGEWRLSESFMRAMCACYGRFSHDAVIIGVRGGMFVTQKIRLTLASDDGDVHAAGSESLPPLSNFAFQCKELLMESTGAATHIIAEADIPTSKLSLPARLASLRAMDTLQSMTVKARVSLLASFLSIQPFGACGAMWKQNADSDANVFGDAGPFPAAVASVTDTQHVHRKHKLALLACRHVIAHCGSGVDTSEIVAWACALIVVQFLGSDVFRMRNISLDTAQRVEDLPSVSFLTLMNCFEVACGHIITVARMLKLIASWNNAAWDDGACPFSIPNIATLMDSRLVWAVYRHIFTERKGTVADAAVATAVFQEFLPTARARFLTSVVFDHVYKFIKPDGAIPLTLAEKIQPRSDMLKLPSDHLVKTMKKSIPAGAVGDDEIEGSGHQHDVLPADEYEDDIANAVRTNSVVVVAGETGCGKSSRVPVFLLRDYRRQRRKRPFLRKPCIVVTQPRRMAAVSLAKRVAGEFKEHLGQTVGYRIGGDAAGYSSSILYVTTGWLFQKIVHDVDFFDRCTHIILDEVHERDLDTDFTCVVIKKYRAARARQGGPHGGDDSAYLSRLVLMSATLKSELLCQYFEPQKTPVQVFVGMKRFPVDCVFMERIPENDFLEMYFNEHHRKIAELCPPFGKLSFRTIASMGQAYDKRQKRIRCVTLWLLRALHYDYWSEVMEKDICEISTPNDDGNCILVFVDGMMEMEAIAEELEESLIHHELGREMWGCMEVCLVHSLIDSEVQMQIHRPVQTGCTRIVLSTTICESSVTVPHVKFVIDTGICKVVQYDDRSRRNKLVASPISQASAIQRSGRCGRLCPGTAFRLYSEADFDKLLPYNVPEVKKVSLAGTVLRLKGAVHGKEDSTHPLSNVRNVLASVIEPPSIPAVNDAYSSLIDMKALDRVPGVKKTASSMDVVSCSAEMDLDPSYAVKQKKKDLTSSEDSYTLTEFGLFASSVPTSIESALFFWFAKCMKSEKVFRLALIVMAVLSGDDFYLKAHPLAMKAENYADLLHCATASQLEYDGNTFSDTLGRARVVVYFLLQSNRLSVQNFCHKRGIHQMRFKNVLMQVRRLIFDICGGNGSQRPEKRGDGQWPISPVEVRSWKTWLERKTKKNDQLQDDMHKTLQDMFYPCQSVVTLLKLMIFKSFPMNIMTARFYHGSVVRHVGGSFLLSPVNNIMVKTVTKRPMKCLDDFKMVTCLRSVHDGLAEVEGIKSGRVILKFKSSIPVRLQGEKSVPSNNMAGGHRNAYVPRLFLPCAGVATYAELFNSKSKLMWDPPAGAVPRLVPGQVGYKKDFDAKECFREPALVFNLKFAGLDGRNQRSRYIVNSVLAGAQVGPELSVRKCEIDEWYRAAYVFATHQVDVKEYERLANITSHRPRKATRPTYDYHDMSDDYDDEWDAYYDDGGVKYDETSFEELENLRSSIEYRLKTATHNRYISVRDICNAVRNRHAVRLTQKMPPPRADSYSLGQTAAALERSRPANSKQPLVTLFSVATSCVCVNRTYFFEGLTLSPCYSDLYSDFFLGLVCDYDEKQDSFFMNGSRVDLHHSHEFFDREEELKMLNLRLQNVLYGTTPEGCRSNGDGHGHRQSLANAILHALRDVQRGTRRHFPEALRSVWKENGIHVPFDDDVYSCDWQEVDKCDVDVGGIGGSCSCYRAGNADGSSSGSKGPAGAMQSWPKSEVKSQGSTDAKKQKKEPLSKSEVKSHGSSDAKKKKKKQEKKELLREAQKGSTHGQDLFPCERCGRHFASATAMCQHQASTGHGRLKMFPYRASNAGAMQSWPKSEVKSQGSTDAKKQKKEPLPKSEVKSHGSSDAKRKKKKQEKKELLREAQKGSTHGQDLFPCERCGRHFASATAMCQHQASTGHGRLKMFLCTLCGCEFVTARALEKHQENTGHGFSSWYS